MGINIMKNSIFGLLALSALITSTTYAGVAGPCQTAPFLVEGPKTSYNVDYNFQVTGALRSTAYSFSIAGVINAKPKTTVTGSEQISFRSPVISIPATSPVGTKIKVEAPVKGFGTQSGMYYGGKVVIEATLKSDPTGKKLFIFYQVDGAGMTPNVTWTALDGKKPVMVFPKTSSCSNNGSEL